MLKQCLVHSFGLLLMSINNLIASYPEINANDVEVENTSNKILALKSHLAQL